MNAPYVPVRWWWLSLEDSLRFEGNTDRPAPVMSSNHEAHLVEGIENLLPPISVKRLDHHYHCSNPGEKLPPHRDLLFASVNQLSLEDSSVVLPRMMFWTVQRLSYPTRRLILLSTLFQSQVRETRLWASYITPLNPGFSLANRVSIHLHMINIHRAGSCLSNDSFNGHVTHLSPLLLKKKFVSHTS